MTALGMRVGGEAVGPGQARALAVPLPRHRGQAGPDDIVPALVITGHRPGPSVAILAGARGFEVNAARLVSELEAWLPPAEVTGTIVLVPVLRPGGRFAAGGRPVKPALVWHFPGDPTGSRAARDAFAAYSAIFEVLGDAGLVLTLAEADPGRVTATAIKGDLDDPRARRLMRASGATALLPGKRRPSAALPDGLVADATHLELTIPPLAAPRVLNGRAPAQAGQAAFDDARTVLRRLLYQVGAWTPERPPAPAPRPLVCRHVSAILAPAGGFLEALAAPGTFVVKGDPLARISPPLGQGAVTVAAPGPGIVLEAPDRAGTRRGAKLFVLGRTARTNSERLSSALASRAAARPLIRPTEPPPQPAPGPRPLYLGWVERVSLPDLGVEMMAKIDTGARTSALHVTRMRAITGLRGLDDGPRRPLLELTIPRSDKRPRADRVVRVRVRDFVQIKDSSGRTERRPVIETTLRLGAVKRKVRVTLTDRGDMTYPMLIGRTALGAGVLIDPARRRLLDPPRGKAPQRKT